ncbi:MAG: C_GCAxxG_C_C family protein [Verrucomicrobia bacterium]|nr:C_GCAxxG_C_C family protein [Verrucomicrobiota bacterium]
MNETTQQMNHDVTRRQFLAATGLAALAPALAPGITGTALGQTASPGATGSPQETAQTPWPYRELDPGLVAKRAYAAYYTGKGCMFGAFEGLIGELREKVGSPYTQFPVNMMEYGKGGVNGIWGTLCGTLNASAAAINLVSGTPAPLINEMFFWYSQEMLPGYKPETPKYAIAESVAGSPICHVSVQRWCEVSGFKPTSPERAERCACLTAEVAKHTAELLNKQAGGSFAASHQLPDEVQSCMACHGKGARENVHHGGNMSCTQCHSDIVVEHPSKRLLIRWTGKGTLEKADAVNGPWSPAASQSNPQSVSPNDPAKFYRLK